MVLLAFAICEIKEPRFLSGDNLRSILLYLPIIAVVAMGQMMVIVSRNIDLSVGSILALAAIVVGNLYVTHPSMPLPVAMLAAMGVGAILGLLNGVLVALLRVPSIIATLGTLTAYRGLVYLYSDGKQVDRDALLPLVDRGLWWVVAAAVLVMGLTAAWLRYTRAGRSVFAIGSNPHAASLRGIAVTPVLLTIFTVTGLLSGLAGLMFAARFGYVNPVSTGASMELVVISAVVIGGTNVFGGSGTVVGVLLGCILLALVNTALPMLNISAFWQQAFYGAAILLAAGVDVIIQRRAAGRSELA
ncbi:ABC transporter permease [bacterium]|nr:MAG: ABC transporter permease [bacterium]